MTTDQDADTPVIVGSPPEPTYGPSPLREAFAAWLERQKELEAVLSNAPAGPLETMPNTITIIYADGSTSEVPSDRVAFQDGMPYLKAGCDRDTDGDGNCPIHPNGCYVEVSK